MRKNPIGKAYDKARQRLTDHTDSTMSNQPGPGRTMDLFLKMVVDNLNKAASSRTKFEAPSFDSVEDYKSKFKSKSKSDLREEGGRLHRSDRRKQEPKLSRSSEALATERRRRRQADKSAFIANAHREGREVTIPHYKKRHVESYPYLDAAAAAELVRRSDCRCVAVFRAREARSDEIPIHLAQRMWDASVPLALEKTSSGIIIMRRNLGNRLYSDLIRFNQTVDELVVEIVLTHPNFILKLSKEMMFDILQRFSSRPENSAWISQVLAMRRGFDGGMRHSQPMRHRKSNL